MTKSEAESLIDRLAGVETHEKCGSPEHCVVCKRRESERNPVLLGDILARDMHPSRRDELVRLWVACGSDKSAQQIVEDSGWRMSKVCRSCGRPTLGDEPNTIGFAECCSNWMSGTVEVERLKSHEASELFAYLAELFPESK